MPAVTTAPFSRAVDVAVVQTTSGSGTAWLNDISGRGLIFWVNVTAVSGTTPSCVFRLQWSPDNGTTWIDWDTTNLATTAFTATGTAVLKVASDLPIVANASKNDIVGRQVRVATTISGTTPSFTFSTFYTSTV